MNINDLECYRSRMDLNSGDTSFGDLQTGDLGSSPVRDQFLKQLANNEYYSSVRFAVGYRELQARWRSNLTQPGNESNLPPDQTSPHQHHRNTQSSNLEMSYGAEHIPWIDDTQETQSSHRTKDIINSKRSRNRKSIGSDYVPMDSLSLKPESSSNWGETEACMPNENLGDRNSWRPSLVLALEEIAGRSCGGRRGAGSKGRRRWVWGSSAGTSPLDTPSPLPSPLNTPTTAPSPFPSASSSLYTSPCSSLHHSPRPVRGVEVKAERAQKGRGTCCCMGKDSQGEEEGVGRDKGEMEEGVGRGKGEKEEGVGRGKEEKEGRGKEEKEEGRIGEGMEDTGDPIDNGEDEPGNMLLQVHGVDAKGSGSSMVEGGTHRERLVTVLRNALQTLRRRQQQQQQTQQHQQAEERRLKDQVTVLEEELESYRQLSMAKTQAADLLKHQLMGVLYESVVSQLHHKHTRRQLETEIMDLEFQLHRHKASAALDARALSTQLQRVVSEKQMLQRQLTPDPHHHQLRTTITTSCNDRVPGTHSMAQMRRTMWARRGSF